MTGRILSFRYELLNKIGDGGMSVVYRAKDTILNRIVAIKILREQYTSDEEFKERFRREAQSVAALYHPNIVNVFDVGEDNGLSYIVMELVDGEPLNEIIKREGAMELDKAVLITSQILDALNHAHMKNVIHRDVKPHNIIVSENGLAKITDFGIAKAIAASNLTETGVVIGTVSYTSPEQAKGENATKESDLYSLGIAFYEMLTGKPPFEADTQVGVAMKHIKDTPPPASSINSGVPKDLERVLMRALEKLPEQRWQDARLFKAALMRTAVGENLTKSRANLIQVDVNNITAPNDHTKKFMAQEGAADLGNGKRTENKGNKATRKKTIVTLAIIFVAIATLFVVGMLLNNVFRPPQVEIEVPNVVGLSLDEAVNVLNLSNLRAIVINNVYNETVPANTVIAQEPESGEKRRSNAPVNLTLSMGVERAGVPNFVGMSLREADTEAENNGIVVSEAGREYSDEVPKDRISSQSSPEGSTIIKGQTIYVFLSDGPEPFYFVPNVIGMTEENAKARIISEGFNVGSILYSDNPSYPNGAVIEQSPGPNQKVSLEVYVNLIICDRRSVSSNSSNVSSNKEVNVTHVVPDDATSQEIEIVVVNGQGRTTKYGPKLVESGGSVNEKITVEGTGYIEVIVDGEVIQTHKF